MRFSIFVLGFALGAVLFTTASVIIAWTGATSAPPNGNVAAPLNTGPTDQVKNAGLGVDALAVFGNAIISGTSRYLNFGTTAGSNGYGIRDNAGTMEFKNNGASWTSLVAIPTCPSGSTLVSNGTDWVCSSPTPSPPPAEITFLQATESNLDSDTRHTFTSQSLGTADPARHIIVAIMCAMRTGTSAITGVTVAGVTATMPVQAAAGDDDLTGIAIAAVPTGSSGTIVVNTTDDTECSIAVYRAINLASPTAFHTATNTTDPINLSLNIPSNGIAVGSAAFGLSGAVATSGLTEDYEAVQSDSDEQVVSGSASGLAAETGRPITFNGATGHAVGVAASWQ